MGYRRFLDAEGNGWEAWDTYPSTAERVEGLPHAHGWLTFESADERRRIIGVPEGWVDSTPGELLKLLAAATRTTRTLSMEAGQHPFPPPAEQPAIPLGRRATDRADLAPLTAVEQTEAILARARETLQSMRNAMEREVPPRSD